MKACGTVTREKNLLTGVRHHGVITLLLWVKNKTVWGHRGRRYGLGVLEGNRREANRWGQLVKDLVVPEGKGIEIIRKGAFRFHLHLRSVTLPRGLIRIGPYAFADCANLVYVSLPRGLTTIDENAFSGCDSLTNVTLPHGLTTIDEFAFSRCYSLTTVTLPHGITTIGYAAFRYCDNLTSINLPDGLITIEPYAFYECWNLTSLELPHSVRNVSPSAFARCTSLTSVVFRPPVSRAAFHAWVVGKSRNRSNWELTTLQHTHNVLRLITVMSSWTRDVTRVDLDPAGEFGFSPFAISKYKYAFD